MTDSSLLNSELELQQQEELYQQLLLQVTFVYLFPHARVIVYFSTNRIGRSEISKLLMFEVKF